MPELTTADVARYTRGRLPANTPEGDMAGSAPETQWMLNAAVKAMRRYCGWRVTPAANETVTVDGPGSRLLSLPTLQLNSIVSVTEAGVAVDPGDLHFSKVGLVRKKSGGCWTHHLGSIEVVMNHGHDDATDWQNAVLEMVDRLSALPGNVMGNSGPITQRRVDDVDDRWALTIGAPENQVLFSLINHALVDDYKILVSPS